MGRWAGFVSVMLAAGIVVVAPQAVRADDDQNTAQQPSGEQWAQAMQGMQQAVGAMNTNPGVEAVDFRELKKLMLEQLGPLKRQTISGERNKAMGINTSEAVAQYTGDSETDITMTITDLGSMSGWGGMASGWMQGAEIDSETETGYERTLQLGSLKAHEQYDNQSSSIDFETFIANGRFQIKAAGQTKNVELVHQAVQAIQTGTLEQMAKQSAN